MNAKSKPKNKAEAKSKPTAKAVAIASHRGPDRRHPNAIDIDLNDTRLDVLTLLTILNPILSEVVTRVKARPPVEADDDGTCDAAGGYHNITFCQD